MPGCSRPPVISASSRNREPAVGSSACRSWISLRATSRLQLLVVGDEDLAQAALGVRPQDAEAHAGRRDCADRMAGVAEPDRHAGRAVGHVHEAGLHVGVGDLAEFVLAPSRWN